MEGDKKEKGRLFRFLKNVAEKEADTDTEEKANVEKLQETVVEDTEDTAGDEFVVEMSDKRPSSDLMKEGDNYLKSVRDWYFKKDGAEDTYFSDFLLDGQEPDSDKREFLKELQATAKELTETGADEELQVNAQVCIKVSPDKMEAWLFAFPPKNGGKEFNEELILGALDQCGVVYGIDYELIKKIVRRRAYLKMAVAAQGTEAVDGIDGKITDHYPRIAYTSVEDQDKQSVDFKNLGWLHPVKAGTVICDIVKPVESVDGSRVTGEVLKGRRISSFEIPFGSNTDLNKDESALIATIDGTLYYERGKFHVKDVMSILSDVNLSVGNIDTIGNLEIRGDVLSGFSVQATGNIRIHGMVGCSTVIAGGDIKIGMGVKGNGDGLLQAGGDIECSYIENCCVKARGNVKSGSIVNCDVSSNRNVESQVIVGGTISALRQVHAKTVGNPQRRQTTFFLGNTQEIRQEKIELENNLEILEEELEKMTKDMRFLRNKRVKSQEDKDRFHQLLLEVQIVRTQKDKDHKRLEEINEGIKDYSECELTANLLYPPVVVTIAGDSCMINRELNMCRVWTEDGEVKMQ